MGVDAWLLLAALGVLPCLRVRQLTNTEVAWARDRWLAGCAAVGLVSLASREPAMALVGLAALAQWRTHAQMPAMLIWGAVLAQWCLLRAGALPPAMVSGVCSAVGISLAAMVVAQWCLGKPPSGWTGQRTFAAALLVLTLPFGPLWMLPCLLLAVWLTSSWLAWAATASMLCLQWPMATLAVLCVAACFAWIIRGHAGDTALDRWTIRGASLDALWLRVALWRFMWRGLTWRGRGPGSLARDLEESDQALAACGYCEPLEYAYEYGALGVVAMIAVAVTVAPHLRLGDPLSAAVVGGAILMVGASPTRLASVGGLWWAECALLAGRG